MKEYYIHIVDYTTCEILENYETSKHRAKKCAKRMMEFNGIDHDFYVEICKVRREF